MDDFIKKMSEILEMEPGSLSKNTNFREDTPYWDSMMGFSTLCMIEDDYGVRIDIPEFLKCNTIEELYARTIEDSH